MNWKRLLSLVACAAMLLTLLPASVLSLSAAETEEVVIDNCDTGTETTDFKEGTACYSATVQSGTLGINHGGYSIDLTGKKDWYVEAWLYVSDPALATDGIILEISETIDTNEVQWNLRNYGLVSGWNKLQLPLNAGESFNTIQNVRLFATKLTEELTMKFDDVKLTPSGETAVDDFAMTATTGSIAFVDFSTGTQANVSNYWFLDEDRTDGASSVSYVKVGSTTLAKYTNVNVTDNSFFYINVDDSYISAIDNDLTVRVTFLDKNTDSLRLQYKNTSNEHVFYYIGGNTNSGVLRTVEIPLVNASFNNTVNGGDLRFSCNSGQDIYIARFEIINNSTEVVLDNLAMTPTVGATAFVDFSKGTYANVNTYRFGDEPPVYSFVQLRDTTMAKYEGYFYVGVHDSYIGANDNDVTLRVTYLDNVNDNLKLQYNSTSGDFTDYYIGGNTGSGEIKTAEINLTDASFRSTQGNCDLRFSRNSGGSIYIISVEIINNAETAATVDMTEVEGETAFVDYTNGTYANLDNFYFGDDPATGSTVTVGETTMARFSQYLFIGVDESYIDAEDNDVTVRITYLDKSTGNPVKLQYNSNNPSATPNQNYTDYYVAGTGTGELKTVDIDLTDASFRNAQNGGCDLRIGCNNGGNIYVTRVEIINNEVELPALAFSGASLTLQDNITVNYKANETLFADGLYTDPYVVFELNGVKTTVSEYTVLDGKYVFDFTNIAPHQMNDTIYATLYATFDGEEYASETREYSVATYSYTMLGKYYTDDYAELRTLLVDLLNYGAQSQIYEQYNTDALVNASLTAEQQGWATSEAPTYESVQNLTYATIENPTVTWKGGGLNLKDSVEMRFKIAADSIDGLVVGVTSTAGTWEILPETFEATDGGYYVFFDGFNAGQMSEPAYLTVYDKDGKAVSNTICYSIESYAYTQKNKADADESLNALLEAMMKYGNSAKAYVS